MKKTRAVRWAIASEQAFIQVGLVIINACAHDFKFSEISFGAE
jgi:hypothetical protein